jgi:hypothetical protein
MLALETTMDGAVAGAGLASTTAGELRVCSTQMRSPLRESGTQLRGNLWLLPLEVSRPEGSAAWLHRYMSGVRREFEHSIVATPAAAISNQALTLASLRMASFWFYRRNVRGVCRRARSKPRWKKRKLGFWERS